MASSHSARALSAFLLLFIAAAAASALANPDEKFWLNEHELTLRRLVKKLQEVMETGLPAKGLPPLDPFKLDKFKFHYVAPGFDVYFSAKDIVARKQKNFKLVSLKSSGQPLRTVAIATLDSINLKAANYSVKGTVMNVVPIVGHGQFELEVSNIRLVATGEVNLNVPVLKDLHLKLTVGKVKVVKLTGTLPIVSEVLEEQGPTLLAGPEGQAAVNTVVADYMNLINKYLEALVELDSLPQPK